MTQLAHYDEKYSGIDIDELHKTNNFLKERLDLHNWQIDSNETGGNHILIAEIMRRNDFLLVQEKKLEHVNLESIL